MAEALPPHLLDELRRGRTLLAEDARRQAERDERRRAAEEAEAEVSWQGLRACVERDLGTLGLLEYARLERPARWGHRPVTHTVEVRLPGLATLLCYYSGGANGWHRHPAGQVYGNLWAVARARGEVRYAPDLPRVLAAAEEVALEEAKAINKEV